MNNIFCLEYFSINIYLFDRRQRINQRMSMTEENEDQNIMADVPDISEEAEVRSKSIASCQFWADIAIIFFFILPPDFEIKLSVLKFLY